MLPRTRRISKKLFESVHFRSNPSIHTETFSVAYAKGAESHSRFACVCSKKAENKAFRRVRARRTCYQLIERLIPEVRDGYFVAVHIKKGFLEKEDKEELFEVLKGAFKKAGIIADNAFRR